ncbi:MAG: PglZ domain-containing protein [Erysipelotrichaceae bacterium]|nr:MAG: PglZ domain-containing protein [Erysipelotrichaceae bacterium]
MEPIAFETIFKELNQKFCKSSYRVIVFWYDEEAGYKENIVNTKFDNAEVILYQKNDLSIKHRLEHLNSKQNFLVYYPQAKPKKEDDWLIDIVFYSEVFYADPIALIQRTLNIDNTDLRQVLEENSQFFASSQRIKELQKILDISNQTSSEQVFIGMLSVILKLKTSNFDDCLAQFLYKPEKLNEAVKLVSIKMFWEIIEKRFNYTKKDDIDSLAIFLLLANLSFDINISRMSNEWQKVIYGVKLENSIIYVDTIKKDSKFKTEYEEIQNRVSEHINLEEQIKDVELVLKADTFKHFDNLIISWLRNLLVNKGSDYEIYSNVIISRKKSIWFDEFSAEYQSLSAAIDYFKLLKKYSNLGFFAEDAFDLARKYSEEYYLIDLHYRRFTTQYLRKLNVDDNWADLALLIENSYNNSFQEKLSQAFSSRLEKRYGKWIGNQREIWSKIKYSENRLFVIISDALRYEVAAELKDEIDQSFRGITNLDFHISELPSITKIGMAALLPSQTVLLENDGTVTVDGKLSESTEKRQIILKSAKHDAIACRYDEIFTKSKADFSAFIKDTSVVFIYHNVVDHAGESDENSVFSACDTAKNDIKKLIQKLLGNSVSSIAITSDHGFLYRRHKLEEKDKSTLPVPNLEASKRYAITNQYPDNEFLLSFKVLDNDDKYVSIPYSDNSFKTQGGGMNYMHGGGCLQEVVIPYLTLYNARSRDESLKPNKVGITLKTIINSITSRNTRIEFVQTEPVKDKMAPVNVNVYFVDKNDNQISNICSIIGDNQDEEIEKRIFTEKFTLLNKNFDRNEDYFLIIEDIEEKVNKMILKKKIRIDLVVSKSLF